MIEQSNIAGIPLQYQMYIVAGGVILKYLSELYSSVRNGGGLKRILMSFWFGEQLPHVVATDYKKELDTEVPKPEEPKAP
jgi:hypothetical protein